MRRFFVEGRHRADDVVQLGGSDAHKIVNVLRMRSGDAVEIIDSSAQRFKAAVELDGKTVHAKLLSLERSDTQSLPRITIAQGLPKGQKMDFVVEKLTELGVATIIPLQSERTIVSDVSPMKIERWRRLAKSASQQSGRIEVPQVLEPMTFAAVLQTFNRYDRVLLPWELAQQGPLRERLPGLLASARDVLVLIGPEGGFSHDEAEAAAAAGAETISLGSRILRTESAGLVALAVIAYVTEP